MPNIQHALLIGASVDKVYSTITTEERLSAWWTPDTNGATELNSVVRFPFGSGYFKEMKITELKPSELVKWNCIKGADEWIGTTISFKFSLWDKLNLLDSHPEMQGQMEQQSAEKGTMLIFNHDDWKEYSLMFAECNYTWGQFLRSLKLLCETGKGWPWPNQHQTQ